MSGDESPCFPTVGQLIIPNCPDYVTRELYSETLSTGLENLFIYLFISILFIIIMFIYTRCCLFTSKRATLRCQPVVIVAQRREQEV